MVRHSRFKLKPDFNRFAPQIAMLEMIITTRASIPPL
jgi:hypothetical protein